MQRCLVQRGRELRTASSRRRNEPVLERVLPATCTNEHLLHGRLLPSVEDQEAANVPCMTWEKYDRKTGAMCAVTSVGDGMVVPGSKFQDSLWHSSTMARILAKSG